MPHNQHQWQTRRQDDRVATNADQAEFAAVQYGSSNIEAGTYDDRVADALDDYEVAVPQETARWAGYDITLDNAASDIGVEIHRRRSILGDAYPFDVSGNQLVYRPSSTLVYEFCLAVSLANSLSSAEFAKLPVAFERLVRDVLVCFLGPGADGLRTGWPPDDHEPRPARFKQVVEMLANRTGEWRWCPEHGLPDDPSHVDVKDEGLDFVIWKAVPDGRPGRLFLVGQCACGNDYMTKLGDIDAEMTKLSKWVRPISCVTPTRIFATPRHIANDRHFEDINRQAGFTLDRARITLMAEAGDARDRVTQGCPIPYAELISIVVPGFQVE